MHGFWWHQKQVRCNLVQEMHACWRLLEKTKAKMTRPVCYTSLREWLQRKRLRKDDIASYTLHQASMLVHSLEQVAFAMGNSNKPISKGTPLVQPTSYMYRYIITKYVITKYKHTHTHVYHSHLITGLCWISKWVLQNRPQNVKNVDHALHGCTQAR